MSTEHDCEIVGATGFGGHQPTGRIHRDGVGRIGPLLLPRLILPRLTHIGQTEIAQYLRTSRQNERTHDKQKEKSGG